MMVSLLKMKNSHEDFPNPDVWTLFIYSSKGYLFRIYNIQGTVIDAEVIKNKFDIDLKFKEFRVQ